MTLKQILKSATVSAIAFLTISCHVLNAQVSGLVLDNVSKEPIPFCSISILGKQMGTVTNERGEFNLPIKVHVASDSLVISHINYVPWKVKLASQDLKGRHLITLEPKVNLLDEVIILAIPVTDLLENVLQTSRSKLITPAVLNTYYREFVKRDTSYISFSDGQIDFYVNRDKDEINSILQVNGSRAFELPVPEDDQVDFDLTSALDVKAAVKYYDPSTAGKFLQKENYNDYDYELHSTSGNQQNELQYILIKPKPEIEKLLFEGKIVFDPKTNLIQSITASASPSHLKFSREVNAVLLKLQVLSGSLMAQYSSDGDHYRLSYLKKEIGLRIWNKRKIDRTFTFLSDLVTFKIDTTTSPKTYPRKNNYSKNALSKRGTNYLTEFWKEGAGLPLTSKEEKIIASLNGN